MSAESVSEAVERINRCDTTLYRIGLSDKHLTDAELAELADCLLAHPDVVTQVWLGCNQLTDKTGVKLAWYLAASSTIQTLGLYINQLGSEAYLALAAALCTNSSLQVLFLYNNQDVNRTCIEAAFVEALRLNPVRPADSLWWMYSPHQDEFERLKHAAGQLGHPSLQSLLLVLMPDQTSNKDTEPASSRCIVW